MKFPLTLLFILITCYSLACINEYRVKLNGEVIYTNGHDGVPYSYYKNLDQESKLKELQRADSIYRKTGKLEDYSDYGVMLVYNGKYSEAKSIFQKIEKNQPGLYATAANLGTVYELIGKNDSAYYWIDKAIKINPESHDGSEWIHLKILEAKIKAENDSGFFDSYNILELDFGNNVKPINRNNVDLGVLRE